MPLTGGSRDYVVVGSDSGKIVIVEYSADKGCFERVHAEVYGKTGCRRIVPGQFVATDPRGRAVMIGAIEKQKLVYILNRDTAARLTISSPLEVRPLAARAARCRLPPTAPPRHTTTRTRGRPSLAAGAASRHQPHVACAGAQVQHAHLPHGGRRRRLR